MLVVVVVKLCVSVPSFSRQRLRSASFSAFRWLSTLLCCSRAFSRSSCLRDDSRAFLLFIYTRTQWVNTIAYKRSLSHIYLVFENILFLRNNVMQIHKSLAGKHVSVGLKQDKKKRILQPIFPVTFVLFTLKNCEKHWLDVKHYYNDYSSSCLVNS